MHSQRKLVLRRESLAELDGGELRAVAGGTHIRTNCNCITHGFSCDDCDLPSLPINTCVCNTHEICWAEPASLVC